MCLFPVAEERPGRVRVRTFVLTKDSHLRFEEHTGLGHDHLRVWNHRRAEYLGEIRATRCGKFMQWTFDPANDTYFTRPCLEEIEFQMGRMNSMYGRAKKHFLKE